MFKTILLSLLGALLVVAFAGGAYYALTNADQALAAPEASFALSGAAAENAAASSINGSSVAPVPSAAFNHGNAPVQGNGNGNGKRYGQGAVNQTSGQNTPNPQADLSQAVTVQGTVVKFEYGTLTLQTQSGELVAIQLGNQNYLRQINFVPVTGEALSVLAFLGDQGLLTAVSITRLSDGSVYSLRDSTIGRPLWTGGGWGRRGGRQP